MDSAKEASEVGTSGGRFALYARRTVVVLSLVCLIAAAGMMVGQVVTQVRETERLNAEREAAGPKVDEPKQQVVHIGPLTIQSLRQSAEHGMSFYDGDVQIILPPLSLRCQHVQLEAEKPGTRIRLAGYGGVAAQGIPHVTAITADNFTFDSREGGLLTLAGAVQVEGPAGLQKYRVCSIALDGRIVQAKSLLDDFAASQNLGRKLALLDDIAVIYRDEELPPEASWLLAMKLLERHLTWHGGREQGAKSKEQEIGNIWPEAHTGERWMRPDAEKNIYWRLNERRHVDVLRAVKLLGMPGADAADNARRKAWLTEIERNNTLLRMIVEPVYRPSQAAAVTFNVCNSDRLTWKLYRVGNGAAWSAVSLRKGHDFIYADAATGFAPITEPIQGPKKLGELMENMVTEWTVDTVTLPLIESKVLRFPFAGPGNSWSGNRKVTIAAESLSKPGYYVLSLASNGETAFAPIRVE